MPEKPVQEFWWANAADFLLGEEDLADSDAEEAGDGKTGQQQSSKPNEQAKETIPGEATRGTAELELPPAVPSAYVIRPARSLEAGVFRAVRSSYKSTVWELAGVRDGPKDSVEVLRPPAQICPPDTAVWEQGRIYNPISALGSCACPAERVRPAFLRFCLDHVRRALPQKGQDGDGRRGLVYATLGSGELYHDWEVLERLLDEGYTLESVHAVDLAYARPTGTTPGTPGSSAATSTAVRALAAWLEACGVPLCAYQQFSDLLAAGLAGFDGADILMQCDMDCSDIHLESAMRPGGLHLHLSQGEGKWFQAWQRPVGEDENQDGTPDPADDAVTHARTDGLLLLEQRHGVLGTAPSEQLRYRSLEEVQEEREDDASDDEEAADANLHESSTFDAALHAAQSAFVDIFEEETGGGTVSE